MPYGWDHLDGTGSPDAGVSFTGAAPRSPGAPRVSLAMPVMSVAGAAQAYRPFDGTDADVAEYGTFELELGPVHWYAQAGANYLIAPATVLNLGFAPGWELVGDLQNFVALDPAPGKPQVQLLEDDVFVKGILVHGSLPGRGALAERRGRVRAAAGNVNGVDGLRRLSQLYDRVDATGRTSRST